MGGRSNSDGVTGLQPTTTRREGIGARLARQFGRSALLTLAITVTMLGFAGEASAMRSLPPGGAGYTSVGCDPVLHQIYLKVPIWAQSGYPDGQRVGVDLWIWSSKTGWTDLGWKYATANQVAYIYGGWTPVPAAQYSVYSNYAWYTSSGWQTRAETIGYMPPAPDSITYYAQYDSSRYSHASTTCFA